MAISTGKRPGRERGPSGTSRNIAKFKLSNVKLTDAGKTCSFWHDGNTGDYTLLYDGDETANISWEDAAGDLETALEALSSITAVTVFGVGTRKDPFRILFVNPSSSFTPVSFTNSMTTIWTDSDRVS